MDLYNHTVYRYMQFKKSEDRQILEALKVKFILNVPGISISFECECYIIMQIQ